MIGEGTATDLNITVANTYNGLPVTAIAEKAFVCSALTKDTLPHKITSVTIPEGITHIGENAFSNCTNLKKVTLPNSLVYIGDMAFTSCTLLKENCENKENGVLYFGNFLNPYLVAFGVEDEKIETLTQITVNENCKFISTYAFYGCLNVTKITLPNGLLSINTHAFFFCDKVEEVSFPSTLNYVGANLFCQDVFIKNKLTNLKTTAENGLYYLGNEQNPYLLLLYANDNLTTANVNANCKLIYSIAFKRQSDLNNVNFGENSILSYIGDSAFTLCIKLPLINLPKTLKIIHANAFSGCEKLSTLTFGGSRAEWDKILFIDGKIENVFCAN